ncbi:MAG TPA: hypothetical protein VG873_10940 [Burkholderiales bacterium]|jgi:hypothetical protein|nr:hypothetical protein [Burkholderiales bacterium]
MRFAIPVLLLLSGCASLDEDRATWYGATFEEVRAAWGTPATSSKTQDGADVHTWVNESPSGSGASVGVGFGVFRGSGNVGVGVGTGVSVPVGERAPNHRCERRMTFRDGQVFDIEWIGTPERACNGYQKPK